MAIPEAQLEVWSHVGAVAQSRDTYAAVKQVLDHSGSPYYAKNFNSSLQGSYGNATNVARDSDVDVLMRLDSTFYHDVPTLPAAEQAAFERDFPGNAAYSLIQFKTEVVDWLTRHFPAVRVGKKAVFIPGSGNRRDCDVLVCARFRYYYRFSSVVDQRYDEGICFFLPDGTRIVNFPEQHSANCTHKHAQTSEWFKPTVRIYKNMRNRMLDLRLLRDGVAPSYFIEGLLWNVPPEHFGRSYSETFVATLNFLITSERSGFKCANGIHTLLADGSQTSWSPASCEEFIDALRSFWNTWR